MFTRTNYSGYLLENRDEVLASLAAQGHTPAHSTLVFEHVTFAYPDPSPAPAVSTARIVAVASDAGVQAVVVELDGTTTRPDGKVFHCTYSLAPGHRPVESNALLAKVTPTPITPIELELKPF